MIKKDVIRLLPKTLNNIIRKMNKMLKTIKGAIIEMTEAFRSTYTFGTAQYMQLEVNPNFGFSFIVILKKRA